MWPPDRFARDPSMILVGSIAVIQAVGPLTSLSQPLFALSSYPL